MSDLFHLTTRLRSGLDLAEADCMAAATDLTHPDIDPAAKKAFLEALHEKGESVGEVTAFARVFRDLASDPCLSDVAGEAIDIVGTGGTGSRGFNISSVTAFIAAAAGVKVLKHGNRAITSQSGSADFLAEYGIRMDTDPVRLRQAVDEIGFCFFFAPAFHPAYKEIIPVRKELAAEGKRTIFNILGPLINPARPAFQLLGVLSPAWVRNLAQALDSLGLRNGLAVCCSLPDGGHMDELTTAGSNVVQGFGQSAAIDETWSPEELGFPRASQSDLAGGSAVDNVALLEAILRGEGPQGLVDSLVLNAGAAFHIVGRVASRDEGCALARETLLGGKLRDWLHQAQAFYRETAPPQ
jgi:anthranilate phosphoribosyltransferase